MGTSKRQVDDHELPVAITATSGNRYDLNLESGMVQPGVAGESLPAKPESRSINPTQFTYPNSHVINTDQGLLPHYLFSDFKYL